MVDEAFAKKWYQSWLDAWSSNDPRTLAPIISEDFILRSPTTAHTGWFVQGRDAAVAYLKYVMDAYPVLGWEAHGEPMFAKHQPTVCFPWRGWGTFSGVLNPPGIKGTGRSFEFFGVEVFDFRDGLATELRASYDLLGLMKQIGVYKGPTK